ncbi:TonB family protein [Arenimonas alkanexedens]
MVADFLDEGLQATLALTATLALVLALRRPLRRLVGARLAYAAWALVPLSVAAVWLPLPAATEPATVLTATLAAAWPLDEAVKSTPGSLLPALFVAWAIGACGLAAVMGLRQRRFVSRVQRRGDETHDLADNAGPAVVGLLRPRIVLPLDFATRYSPEQQALVLAHEQLHLQRRDIPAQALASLFACLFWFHPLVHIALTRFRFDQELACDADVIERYPRSRRSYGDAMLKTQLADFGLPAGCHWHSSHPLKERITMLKHPLPGPLRRRAGHFLLAAMLAGATWVAWATQPGDAAEARWLHAVTDDDVLTPPKYPAAALADKVSGEVMLKILVGTDGRAKDILVVSSQPEGHFDKAAMDAARQWQFNAGRDGATGEKVEGWILVPVRFNADRNPETPASGSSAE